MCGLALRACSARVYDVIVVQTKGGCLLGFLHVHIYALYIYSMYRLTSILDRKRALVPRRFGVDNGILPPSPNGFERLLRRPVGVQDAGSLTSLLEQDAWRVGRTFTASTCSRPVEAPLVDPGEMEHGLACAIEHDGRAFGWQLAIELLEVIHVEASLLPTPIAALQAHAVILEVARVQRPVEHRGLP